MSRHHIKLTDEENSLLAKIDLRDSIPHTENAHAIHLANQAPLLALLRSLGERATPSLKLA